MKQMFQSAGNRLSQAFSLIEVVLAVGVLSVSILALLGLFGPTMSSVRDVVDSNEASGISTRLNSALMTDEIYDVLPAGAGFGFDSFAGSLPDPTSGGGTPVILYFWNERPALDSPIELVYDSNIATFQTAFGRGLTEGQSFVVALEQGMQGGSDSYDFSTANVSLEGQFPILVSIYSVPAAELNSLTAAEVASELVEFTEPVFSYTTAKLR